MSASARRRDELGAAADIRVRVFSLHARGCPTCRAVLDARNLTPEARAQRFCEAGRRAYDDWKAAEAAFHAAVNPAPAAAAATTSAEVGFADLLKLEEATSRGVPLGVAVSSLRATHVWPTFAPRAHGGAR